MDELVEQLMEELVEVVVLAHIAFELLMCPVRAFLPSPKIQLKKFHKYLLLKNNFLSPATIFPAGKKTIFSIFLELKHSG